MSALEDAQLLPQCQVRGEEVGNRLQVSVGQMQVDQSVFQAGVSEYDLDGTQVGSGFQPVGRTAMPETVWR